MTETYPIKKKDRTVPLRDYLLDLRQNDPTISKEWEAKQPKGDERGKYIKEIMTDEFIEYCHDLGLSNRNIAYVLNCSAGTIGQYMSEYNSLKMDDISFEKRDFTDEVSNYQIEGMPYFEGKKLEHAFLLVSDIQAGALVTAEGYDSSPAYTVQRYFDLLIERVKEAVLQRSIAIKTLNVVLLGDLVDGWKIFPNHQTVPISQQHDMVVTNILKLLKELTSLADNIDVYGAFGNHGRISRYYPTEDNWDNIAMREIDVHIGYLKQLDETFKNVNSYMSPKEIQILEIGGFKYFITHGHQISGFSVETWKKSMRDWHLAQNGFDVMLMGHWHTFTWVSNSGKDLVVNGCMYRSEYVENKLKGKEDVCQILFGANEISPVAWLDKLDIDQGVFIKGE